MKPIKIFYLITGLYVGGAEKAFLELTRHLDRTKFEPVIGTLVGGDLIPFFERAGVKVYDFGMRHKLDPRVLLRLRRALLRERPVVLHTRLIYADLLGRLMGRWCGVPVIVSTIPMVETIRHHWFWKTLDRWTSQLADAIIVLSEHVRAELIKVERLDPSKFEIIPNGIARHEPHNYAQRQAKRALLGISSTARLIGIVSRLEEPRKGHHILFRAMQQLSSGYPDVYCVVIGDGPARSSLEAQVRQLGLSDRVKFVGTQYDVEAWLSALDLFVLPSLNEGFPMAILEAMAAHRPVIATAVAGVPDIIIDHESGILIPPGNVDALARALQELLDDPELAKRLGEAGRTRFEERFDIRHITRQTETVYTRLLAERQPTLCPRARAKMLLVATSIDSGGVTTYLANLVRQLPRDRYEVALASGPEQFQVSLVQQLDVPHYPIALTKSINPIKDLVAVYQLCRLIRRERFDVVHSHMAKADLVAALAAWFCRVSCIVSTAHGPTRLTPGPSWRQSIFDAFERIYRRLNTIVISVSTATTHLLLTKYRVPPEKIMTIPNGVDVKRIRAAADRENARRRLSLGSEQPVIGIVGRLVAQKSPETLILAMRELVQKWPNLVCLIVGDGPRAAELTQLVRDHQLDRSVRLLGHREDVPALLSALDIFVLPTNYEGMSLSVLEAMAAGLPVIASRVEGMDELVEHERTGLLVPPKDVAACRQAVDWLLSDSVRARRMGQLAFERVQSTYDLEQQIRRTERTVWQTFAAGGAPEIRKPSFSDCIRHFISEEGFGALLRRFAAYSVAPFYSAVRLWLFARSTSEPIVRFTPKVACTIRQATLDDLGRLAAAGFEFSSHIAARLTSGQDLCFIAEQAGRVLAFQWVAIGPRHLYIKPLERSIALHERQAYLYNCRALRAYRSHAIIPTVEGELLKCLADLGVGMVFTDIRDDNLPSLGTFEKLGFKKLEHVSMRRVAGWSSLRCRRPRPHDRSPLRVLCIQTVGHGSSATLDYLQQLDPGTFEVTLVNGGVRQDGFGPEFGGNGFPASDSAKRVPLDLERLDRVGEIVRGVWRLSRLMVRQSTEIVHCQGWKALLLGGMAARLAGVPRLTAAVGDLQPADSFQGTWGVLLHWVVRRLLKRADLAFFSSETARQEAVSQRWTAPERTRWLREDVSLASYGGPLMPSDARRSLGIPTAGPMIGTVAPLVSDVAPWQFLALCRRLKEQVPECQFLLVGDGPLTMVLKRYADELKLSPSIRFLRRDDDRRLLIKAMDVFVHFACLGHRSLASLEAMASGRPVVTIDQAEHQLGQSFSGIDGQTPDDVAQHIVGLLQEPERLALLGRKALAQVEEQFGEQHVALQLAAAWRTLLESDVINSSPAGWRSRHGCTVLSRYAG